MNCGRQGKQSQQKSTFQNFGMTDGKNECNQMDTKSVNNQMYVIHTRVPRYPGHARMRKETVPNE